MIWVDGDLVSADTPVLAASDSAYREGRGCYSTVRVAAGRPRYAARHAARLSAGARALGLGELDPSRVRAALERLAGAAFGTDAGTGEGIIRLQVSGDANGLRLIGTPRPLLADPPEWSAIRFPGVHDGGAFDGLKVTNRLTLALAGQAAQRAGVDEAILFDASDQLVEGARTNLFCVLADGTLATPPLASGAVAGIARAICLEGLGEIRERTIAADELASARELVATNAVRGARAIVVLDARRVGDGQSGPLCARLAERLASESATSE